MSTSKDCAIAVFVKTPGLSPVKTRLAESIGKQAAEDVYRLCLQVTENTICESIKENSGLQAFWAIAEPEGTDDQLWMNFPTLLQEGDGLGARIHSIFSHLKKRYQSVVILGGDSPALTADLVSEAITQAKTSPYVIGKTEDGGFYIFASQRAVPEEVWNSVDYSTNTTADQLIEELEKIDSVLQLPQLYDVDTAADLNRAATEVPELVPFAIH